jgi:hypothetical protein
MRRRARCCQPAVAATSRRRAATGRQRPVQRPHRSGSTPHGHPRLALRLPPATPAVRCAPRSNSCRRCHHRASPRAARVAHLLQARVRRVDGLPRRQVARVVLDVVVVHGGSGRHTDGGGQRARAADRRRRLSAGDAWRPRGRKTGWGQYGECGAAKPHATGAHAWGGSVARGARRECVATCSCGAPTQYPRCAAYRAHSGRAASPACPTSASRNVLR